MEHPFSVLKNAKHFVTKNDLILIQVVDVRSESLRINFEMKFIKLKKKHVVYNLANLIKFTCLILKIYLVWYYHLIQ